MKCYQCSHELDVNYDFGRQDLCGKCRWPTRVCLNCIHYDTSRYNECTEPVADRVVEKDKGNFCDYFKPGQNTAAGKSAGKDPKSAALEAAEALFKSKK